MSWNADRSNILLSILCQTTTNIYTIVILKLKKPFVFLLLLGMVCALEKRGKMKVMSKFKVLSNRVARVTLHIQSIIHARVRNKEV